MNLKIKVALWGVFFMFLGGVLLWQGISMAWVSWTNRVPTKLSCEAYISKGTKARWVHLSGCYVDARHAVIIYEKGHKSAEQGSKHLYTHAFVPLRKGPKDRSPVKVLKLIAHPGHVRFVQTYLKLKKRGPYAKRAAFEKKHAKRLRRLETVRGVLRFGNKLNHTGYEQLRLKTPYRLAQPYAVLDEGRKPEGTVGLMLAAASSIFILAGIGIFGKGLRAKEPPDKVQDGIDALLDS